uniref:L1 transposable element RRM domain-containing protein n=1 Tax=Seriola dumerili TaxID=41447 RepID=A0A3B4U078_SERDU
MSEREEGAQREYSSRKQEDMEGGLNRLDGDMDTLSRRLAQTEQTVQDLRAKVDDMENRSRRCNLRLTGLPEGCEGGSPTKYVEKILQNILGADTFPNGVELQRAHRSLMSRPKPGQPPRAIIMQFLRYQDKERALTAARRLGTLRYENNTIRLYPDYSFELQQKRRRFDETKKILREKRVEYRLVYPARLLMKHAGKDLIYTDPGEALKFYYLAGTYHEAKL